MKKIILLAFVVIVLTGCADASPEMIECADGHTYGFWAGLWHGVVAPFALIGSLFNSDITVYAINNNGGWYDFGFIIGIGALTGGGGSSVKK